jgi:hypothetical protein
VKLRGDWQQSALDELTTIWLDSDAAQRLAISVAARAIDRQLQFDADRKGETRPDGRRVLFSEPLADVFRVIPQDVLVRVVKVWRY